MFIEYNDAGLIVAVKPSNRIRIAHLLLTYDLQGRIKKAKWANSTIDFSYDRRNRITQLAMGPSADLLQRFLDLRLRIYVKRLIPFVLNIFHSSLLDLLLNNGNIVHRFMSVITL